MRSCPAVLRQHDWTWWLDALMAIASLPGFWNCASLTRCRPWRPLSPRHANKEAGAQTRCVSGFTSPDRKSTRLNSSHTVISYAVFCLKKKKKVYDAHETNEVSTVI